MPNHRPAVPADLKRSLIAEAGNKCANPGCPNELAILHHIREWHVYESHEENHMIAVCGACHDAIHRGDLRISDDDLYQWKSAGKRADIVPHVYVEPGPAPILLLGSLAFEGDDGLTVFELTAGHRLSFALVDDDIVLMNLSVSTPEGERLIDVVDGYVRRRSDTLMWNSSPGHLRVPGNVHSPWIPEWRTNQMLAEDPLCGLRNLPLLDLNVYAPGTVKVQGVWMREESGIVITEDRLSMYRMGQHRPVSFMGSGVGSLIHFTGPVSQAVLRLP